MTDAVHSYRAPIYADTSVKRLPPSFYWGVGIAVLLHLALAYYLLQQNFAPLVVDNPPAEHNMDVSMDKIPPAKPKTPDQAPRKVIVLHPPALPTKPNIETIPVDPVKPTVTTDAGDTTPPALSPPGNTVTAPPATGPVFVKARWTQFPDGNALADYYPAKAANDEREGVATVQCTVLDAKGHVGCTIVSETPGGYGFGLQTVRMVQDKGRVDTTQGDVQIGSVLRTTVKWQLG